MVAIGDGVTTVGVGDRVVVYPLLTCGTCEFCRSGIGENYCENWRLWGAQTWGGRAELAKVPAANVVSLPDNVSWRAAADVTGGLLDGLARVGRPSTGRRSRHRFGGRRGRRRGRSGNPNSPALRSARDRGHRRRWKRARAAELGAEYVLDSRSENWAQQVREITEGRGATVVFDNVGEATWPQSIPSLGRAGRFVCSGATTGPNFAFDARWAYRNMVGLHFYMLGSRRNLRQLVDLVADGSIDPVIDSCFPLGDIVAAELKLAAQDHFGKIVLDLA